MSREINIDEKLNEADRQYLIDRWDVTRLRRNMMNLGVDQSVAIRAEFMSQEEYESAVAEAQDSAENADTATAPQQPTPVPGGTSSPVPASLTAQQEQGVGLGAATGNDGPTPYYEGTRAFADESLKGKPYDDWTKAQLTAEIEKRNELREGSEEYSDEEPMSTDGLKDDLVKRLQEDDEADAPESAQ